jgi:SAM-dependent methyltransferase
MFAEHLDKEVTVNWKEMHHYSPAPRYRRRLILNHLKKLKFTNCLDVGCAQGYLIQEIANTFLVTGYGCDVSTQVIQENIYNIPACEFSVLDIEKASWPNQRQFDVVVSSEVVEHISDWKTAIKHLTAMTKHHLIITVPGGVMRTIDRKVGHVRHFKGDEIKHAIEIHGFECQVKRIGFPFHSLYKRLINFIMPDKIYDQFSGIKPYTFTQKFISTILYYSFYLNDFFNHGEQLMIFAKRRP